MTREELILETTVLATDYYFSIGDNDGKEIVNTFRKYFDLVKNEPLIDKQVVGNALTICAIYDRDSDVIAPQYRGSAEEMIWELEKMLNESGKEIVQIYKDSQFVYEDVNSIRKWIKEH